MPDDFVLNVRQIVQYPRRAAVAAGDLVLLQDSSVGAGPYFSVKAADLVSTALQLGGSLQLAPGAHIAWNGAALSWQAGTFSFSEAVAVPSLRSAGDIFVAGQALATQVNLDALFDTIVENSVWTLNGRKGNVQLELGDILRAGAAPIWNAHFGGHITAPTAWDFRSNDDTVATTAFVQMVLNQLLCSGSVVTSFNGRGGAITLTVDDVNAAYAAAVAPDWPRVPSPPLGDASSRIATTAFTDETIEDLREWVIRYIAAGGGVDLSGYAKIDSPSFTGYPTAPTAAAGNYSGQLATTAFVANAVTAATAGVASFNGRTGTVTLQTADVSSVGGALLLSPPLTGLPSAPTAPPGTNNDQIATTAFVMAATAGSGVSSFNTRSGTVVLLATDVTAVGGALLASPTFTGTPAAPTAAVGTSTTQLATTAFVAAAVAASTAGVSSFMGRTGAVTLTANDISAAGGAPLASPVFTGNPQAPLPLAGANSGEIATAAWVNARLATAGGVTSFNTRTGAVTLALTDVTAVGGAPAASPPLTGVPTAPTAAPGTNSTQIATTAFVLAQVGVSSFNTRSGAVTLNLADITGAGGAPLTSPALTGTPTAPTAAQSDNSNTIATTAYIHTALATGLVSSFNGRSGAVSLIANDVSAAGGALLAGPAFTGVPTAPTAVVGTSTTQLATCAFVLANAAAAGVTTFNGRAGAVVLTAADIAATGGAPLTTPTVQRFISGTGSYISRAGASYIEVELVGGGGGGAGDSGGNGGNGGNTTFGGTYVANGGTGGVPMYGRGGLGGATSANGDDYCNGSDGGSSTSQAAAQVNGGNGGSSYYGGRGTGGSGNAGLAAKPNSGSGGGGGSGAAAPSLGYAGSGGGSGGWLRRILPPGTYAYVVGAAGAAGVTGAVMVGGAGAAGKIVVREY